MPTSLVLGVGRGAAGVFRVVLAAVGKKNAKIFAKVLRGIKKYTIFVTSKTLNKFSHGKHELRRF